MPTISVNPRDLALLLGRQPEGEAFWMKHLQSWLPLVKGELKVPGQIESLEEVRVELQDSNRPDLWSCEGIARQIRQKLEGGSALYPFFAAATSPSRRLLVQPGLERVRPYVAGCAALGYQITDAGLAQLIQVQEKLSEIFGRQRRSVSIGLYRLQPIVFPVTYTPAHPDEVHFTPLGFDDKLSLRDILTVHPKGIEYGPILAGHERVPLLVDDAGQVLSFPPIINSREIGEVRIGDQDLLVEVTGTDLQMALLTLNILAVNLADRGAIIEPIIVTYPYETEFGKAIRTPMDFSTPRSIPLQKFESALGQPLKAERIREALTSYGYEAKLADDRIDVKLPPYRNDLMHPVDVVEDVAISLGYSEFAPVMPATFTVGGLSPIELLSDRIRDLLVGFGFQEVISNILASRHDLSLRMRLAGSPWDRLIEVDNVMSQSYSYLRRWMLPSLLRVEAASTRAFYPHRLFEVGEVAVPEAAHELGARTVVSAGALIAHTSANFSEAHSCVDLLLYYLTRPYTLEPLNHPSFLDGRAGSIVSGGRVLGLIGELHPEVLEQWQLTMPCAAFELIVDDLAALNAEVPESLER